MLLPHEDAICEGISQRLEPELTLASELLDLGSSVFTSGNEISPGDGVDDLVILTALGVLAKAGKQYRSVTALVEIGVGEGAESVGRMLFETMLVTHFLLRRRVVLKRNGVNVPPVAGKPLTTRFRTYLYLANDAFNGRKFIRNLQTTPGLRRKVPAAMRAVIEQNATDWEAVIGPIWTQRVRDFGYAGINVKDLADSFDYHQLYASLYRIHSAGVHATDATRFVTMDEEAREGVRFSASANTEDVCNALAFGSLAYLGILQVANDRLGLGIGPQADALRPRAHAMRLEFPEA